MSAALDPAVDNVKAAHLALKLIEQADPPQSASLEIIGPLTSDAVEGMSFSELLLVAERMGIDLSRPGPPALAAAD